MGESNSTLRGGKTDEEMLAYLDRLPDDMIKKLASFMKPEEIGVLCSKSKRYKALLCDDNKFRRSTYEERSGYDMKKRCPDPDDCIDLIEQLEKCVRRKKKTFDEWKVQFDEFFDTFMAMKHTGIGSRAEMEREFFRSCKKRGKVLKEIMTHANDEIDEKPEAYRLSTFALLCFSMGMKYYTREYSHAVFKGRKNNHRKYKTDNMKITDFWGEYAMDVPTLIEWINKYPFVKLCWMDFVNYFRPYKIVTRDTGERPREIVVVDAKKFEFFVAVMHELHEGPKEKDDNAEKEEEMKKKKKGSGYMPYLFIRFEPMKLFKERFLRENKFYYLRESLYDISSENCKNYRKELESGKLEKDLERNNIDLPITASWNVFVGFSKPRNPFRVTKEDFYVDLNEYGNEKDWPGNDPPLLKEPIGVISLAMKKMGLQEPKEQEEIKTKDIKTKVVYLTEFIPLFDKVDEMQVRLDMKKNALRKRSE